MIMVHGVGTVNSGIMKEFDVEDPIYKGRKLVLEVLKPEKHNPYAEIICYYYWDTKLKSKVEVTLYRNLKTKTMGSEVYYFRDKKDTQHYYSRNYENFIKMPEKYYRIAQYIEPYFRQIFK